MSKTVATPAAKSTSLSMGTSDWLLLGLLSLLWGSGFLLSTIAVEDIGPPTVVLIRVILASAILYPIIRYRGIAIPRNWHDWRPFIVLGLLNTALPFTLNAWSLTRIESGIAGILTAAVPIFTVIVAHIVTTDERATMPKILGTAVGMAGVIAIIGLDPAALTSGSGLGKLAVLLSCLLYGISAVYARGLPGTPPLLLALGQLSTSALFLIPLVVFVDRPWETASWEMDALLSVLVLSVFGSAAAYLIFYRLLTASGAISASLVAYVIPVVAVLLGTVFLDERLRWQHFLGMVLIIGGMAVIDGRLVKRIMAGWTMRAAEA